MGLIVVSTYPLLLRPFPECFSSYLLSVGSRLRMSLPFCVGHVLVLAGAAIRVHCYRRLRDRFTFELAFREGHKLETGGLYAVVRHPAYTGALLFAGGTHLCVCDSRSLLAAFGVWDTWWGKTMKTVMVGVALLTVYSFVDRTRVEDRALHQRFGEEWVNWTKRTPYRLLPLVF